MTLHIAWTLAMMPVVYFWSKIFRLFFPGLDHQVLAPLSDFGHDLNFNVSLRMLHISQMCYTWFQNHYSIQKIPVILFHISFCNAQLTIEFKLN